MDTKNEKDTSCRVLVLGDASTDWHIVKAEGAAPGAVSWQNPGGHVINRPGGAGLLQLLVKKCLGFEVSPKDPVALDGAIQPEEEKDYLTQTMTICALFSPGPDLIDKNKDKDKDKDKKVIRVDSLCGFRLPQSLRPLPSSGNGHPPDVVVIDDSNASTGIRTQASEVLELLKPFCGETRPWIILKRAFPLDEEQKQAIPADGQKTDLLDELCKHWADRLIVVVPVDDLRHDRFQISRGLSWERTAQDLSWELNYNPRLKLLAEAHALVVPLGLSGVWFSQRDSRPEAADSIRTASTLVYDPGYIEGDWEKERPGLLLGYTSCLTLAIVQELSKVSQSHANPNLACAAKCGLTVMRALHTDGYQIGAEPGSIELPIDRMKEALQTPLNLPDISVPLGYRHYSVPLGTQADLARPAEWSILAAKIGASSKLFKLGMKIVTEGTSCSLGEIPYARFNGPKGLTVVDRNEIEAFRSTYDMIQDYSRNRDLHRPLSLAVFGPPGSGKSFGVTQVATAVAAASTEKIEKITFNVSQFVSIGDLIDAFHRVRDIGLSGSLPLVFWDEFDSAKDDIALFWLKMFLAPMQDGEFTQGQINHPIGRAIFVFAGGTASSIEDLGSKLEESEDKYKEAKVPDFKSRLRGCINMVGIDRRNIRRNGVIQSDPQYVIRRAVVLRSIIERCRKDVIGTDKRANIDEGLLKALLTVWSFKHGTRSLESIIQLCHLDDSGVLHRSSLPPAEVLELHVSAPEFLGLVTADVEFHGDTLETLAAAHHEVYCKVAHDSKLAAISYANLSPEDKENNRSAVCGIPHKLASIRCIYELLPPVTKGDDSLLLPDAEAEHLARLEHDRWIVNKIDDGFVYGEKRNGAASPPTNPDLVPWDALPANALEELYPDEYIFTKLGPGPLRNSVDMELAKRIPEIMRAAGYRVSRL